MQRGEVPVMEEERNMRREASVLRYKEKRQNRLFSKKIRYQVRKLNADKRPRFKVSLSLLFLLPSTYLNFNSFNYFYLRIFLSIDFFWIIVGSVREKGHLKGETNIWKKNISNLGCVFFYYYIWWFFFIFYLCFLRYHYRLLQLLSNLKWKYLLDEKKKKKKMQKNIF